MSDTATVRGTVHLIEPTKTYGQKGFRKRVVVLENDNGRFTNYIPVEFTNDSCETADELNVGDVIEVDYKLNGRKWQRDADSEVKFFLNAEAFFFRVVMIGDIGDQNLTPPPAETNAANDREVVYGDEDVPF